MKIIFLLISIYILISLDSILASGIVSRVGVRLFLYENYLTNELVSAKSLRLQLSMSDILNSGFNFKINFRNGFDSYRTRVSRSKLYDLSISNNSLWGNLGFTFGRINSSIVGAYGMLDGISLKYRQSENYSFGMFFGMEPDIYTFKPDDKIKRLGLFMQTNYLNRYQGNVSLIQQTYLNDLDRVFLYFDNFIEISEHWSFNQSAELDLVEKPEDKVVGGITLTNIFADVRFSPNRNFNITANYHIHQDYKLLESMYDIPDSLFESAVGQSYGIRTNIRPFSTWRIYGSFRYGLRDDETGSETFSSIGLSNHNLFNSRTFLNMRYSQNNGYYAKSNSMFISAEHSIIKNLRASLGYHFNNLDVYTLTTSTDSHTLDMTFSYNFPEGFFIYLRGIRTFGDIRNDSRMLVEFNYRFRSYTKKVKH